MVLTLPTPGGDTNTWGDELNAWLEAKVAGVVNVLDHGADATATTDSTAAFQDALDAANDASIEVPGVGGVLSVLDVPTGRYLISDELDWGDCFINGPALGGISAEIIWNGAAGGTVIRKAETGFSHMSFGGMQGLRFREGDNEPATWLNLESDTQVIDVLFQLERVHFGSADIPIVAGSWINAHWSHLRFDGYHEYAISLSPGPGQSYSNFVLDKFTADNATSGTASKAFMRVTHPDSGTVNIGGIHLSNARIEINSAQRTPNCVMHFVDPASISANGSVLMTNVNVAATLSTPLDCVVYREADSAVWGTPTILNGCTVYPANTPVNGAASFLGGYSTVNASIYCSLVLDAADLIGVA